MEYLPLCIFGLGGIALALAAKHVAKFGPHNLFARGFFTLLFYSVSAIAAYLSVVWWQAVILGKGGLWTIQHYFPSPGVWFMLAVLTAQITLAHMLWLLIDRNEDRFWRRSSR